jgi:hypothetical protein
MKPSELIMALKWANPHAGGDCGLYSQGFNAALHTAAALATTQKAKP